MPRLLLVEDNEENRDGLSRHLRRKGFEVLVAVDGQQGVEAARSEAPDLILMDMSLPVLDGWEATRQLKADAGDPAHPGHRPDRPRDGRRPGEGARRPGATSTTPSRSSSPACSAKIQALLGGPAPAGEDSHG